LIQVLDQVLRVSVPVEARRDVQRLAVGRAVHVDGPDFHTVLEVVRVERTGLAFVPVKPTGDGSLVNTVDMDDAAGTDVAELPGDVRRFRATDVDCGIVDGP
jgi:hypothetical protein